MLAASDPTTIEKVDRYLAPDMHFAPFSLVAATKITQTIVNAQCRQDLLACWLLQGPDWDLAVPNFRPDVVFPDSRSIKK